MKDFLYAIIIAFSFFTVIPLPMVEWTNRRMRFLPLLMPLVGLGIGSLGYGLYFLLGFWDISAFSSSVFMVLFFLAITGGLHMDGLMDTADACFSRRSQEKKLEIMKDSRVGAFAVMALVSLLLLKIACFYEVFSKGQEAALLVWFIPVFSRIGQAFILGHFPFAKKDGLAVIFHDAAGSATSAILVIYFVLTTVLVYYFTGVHGLVLPFGLLLFTLFYYFSAQKNFGGITGDIVGAYVELAEAIMLFLLVAN